METITVIADGIPRAGSLLRERLGPILRGQRSEQRLNAARELRAVHGSEWLLLLDPAAWSVGAGLRDHAVHVGHHPVEAMLLHRHLAQQSQIMERRLGCDHAQPDPDQLLLLRSNRDSPDWPTSGSGEGSVLRRVRRIDRFHFHAARCQARLACGVRRVHGVNIIQHPASASSPPGPLQERNFPLAEPDSRPQQDDGAGRIK